MLGTTVARFSFSAVQLLNEGIYGKANKRFYDHPGMVTGVQKYGSLFLSVPKKTEGEDKEEQPNPYYLAMSFSWLLGSANMLGIEVQQAILKRYSSYGDEARLIREFQKSYSASLRLKNDEESKKVTESFLSRRFACLANEVGNFCGMRTRENFLAIHPVIADTAAAICGVAESRNFDLVSEFAVVFENGCPKCHESVCETCGFMFAEFPKALQEVAQT